ncbi:hypothetical protein Q2T40_05005 [Winogradskyella maritima]|nr:hypothetical protein [Winogradskyella maritima]
MISPFCGTGRTYFQRYQGELSYRIKDFTKINLNYTYYTIDEFFSNAFQLGIQYNFKLTERI